MADSDRKVELVRVPREERYYAAEEVLGRDASSVFPTEARKGTLESDAVRALLGGDRKFISETELQEIKAATGGRGRVEDGSIAADKPLAEVLREAKEAKEAKFQEQWRQMKTGKNRPLDEDELDFLDSVAQAEAQRQRQEAAEEEEELAAYHRALREQEEARADAAAAAEAAEAAGPSAGLHTIGPALPAAQPPAAAGPKPKRSGIAGALKPVIRPKPPLVVQSAATTRGAARGSEPEAKRRRPAAAAAEDSGGEGGLQGLLSGYGSGSGSDS